MVQDSYRSREAALFGAGGQAGLDKALDVTSCCNGLAALYERCRGCTATHSIDGKFKIGCSASNLRLDIKGEASGTRRASTLSSSTTSQVLLIDAIQGR